MDMQSLSWGPEGWDDETRRYMEERGLGELAETLGFEVHRLSAEHSVIRMPVAGARQPIGLVHGGAYCVLGETLGSLSANMHARTQGKVAVGVDINATHTRSAREGYVYGECRALHLGSSMTVHEIVCTNDEGKRCSTVRITNFLKEAR